MWELVKLNLKEKWDQFFEKDEVFRKKKFFRTWQPDIRFPIKNEKEEKKPKNLSRFFFPKNFVHDDNQRDCHVKEKVIDPFF